ncbi:hypothetical protein ACFU3E_18355 [Streptomyces sp. NPDC057424]|uniref:hypothetical protein n=1 Tax=Streptomyces sp. NPDC057424 TaxID=3346127 RepID=UPI0036A34D4A
MLAALGHQAVADGVVPWRFVMLSAGAQFVVVRPFVRRSFSLPAVLGCALAVQGALHLALEIAGERLPAGTVHVGHAAHGMAGHAAVAAGDGHAWHASAAMTAVHVPAALAVAWLLHRADAAVAAALGIARGVRGIAASVAAWARSLWGGGEVRPLPSVPGTGCPAPPARAQTYLLGHAMVRRGPPGHLMSRFVPHLGGLIGLPRFLPLGASLCPCTTPPARRAVSPWPASPR